MKPSYAAIAAALTCLLAAQFASPPPAQAAEGYDIVLQINSADFGGPDTSLGDGQCTASGTVTIAGATKPKCTLRAALEEANYLGGTKSVLVTLDEDWTGTHSISATANGWGSATDAWMVNNSNLSTFAANAYYQVTAPMVIDLDNRLGIAPASDADANAIYISGTDISLLNASNIFSGDTSILIGNTAKRITISGGESVQTANYRTERFLVIQDGAETVTFSHYAVGGLLWEGDDYGYGAVVFTTNGASGRTTRNVTIDDVDFTSPQTGTTCNDTDGSGCVNSGIVIGHTDGWSISYNAHVSGLTIKNSTFKNISRTNNYAISTYSAGSLENLDVNNNVFANNSPGTYTTTNWNATFTLPYGKSLGGTNYIRGNQFTNSTVAAQLSVSWVGPNSGTTASNLYIQDNYFDGQSVAGVYISGGGTVTMERNTFGSNSASKSGSDEESSTSGVMVANLSNTNQQIRTWYPSASPTINSCVVSLAVSAPTASAPRTPVRLDVYWTQDDTAEVFVGSFVQDSGSTATLQFPAPPQAVSDNGTLSGKLRVQTQSMAYSQLQSSQYSRTVNLTGTCAPQITIQQVSAYGDSAQAAGSTMTRIIEFTVTSSVPLAGDLAADDFSLAGSTATGARIYSVTKNDDGSYTVRAIADDTGDIVVSLAANAATMAGTSLHIAGSTTGSTPDTDNEVRFVNPLSVPQTVEVGGGDPYSSSAGTVAVTYSLADGAPGPTAAIEIAVSPRDGLDVTTDPSSAIIDAGTRVSSPVTITGPTAPTSTTTGQLQLTVTSSDQQYDGLILGPQQVEIVTIPGILEVSPDKGLTDGGTQLTIVGVGFVTIFDTSAPTSAEVLAAWTVNGETVYGHYNPDTGTLTQDESFIPITRIAPTVVTLDGESCTDLTVTSMTELTCLTPAHASGRVDITATINGEPANTLQDAYLYWADGELTVHKRAWLNAPADASYDDLISPGHAGATEIPSGSQLAPGTQITWTYTVEYHDADTESAQTGLKNVAITDDKLGNICTIGDLPTNSPTGCTGTGSVTAS